MFNIQLSVSLPITQRSVVLGANSPFKHARPA